MTQPQPGEDLRMMKSPTYWPAGDVLPLKKRKLDNSGWDTGLIIFHHPNKFYFVENATMFESIMESDPRVHEMLPDQFQELIDKGWIVD